ncbi:hypothetical protein ACIOWI_35735 [Streptomyces sp. NPDC087659]|uniref:hypothetical protein n=1 Tax=Streptomyces sp. NPDC087659 TaxID=3365801 RepID=UPI00382F24F1
MMEQVGERLAALAPLDADAADAAKENVRIVGLPAGERPFRSHIDPADDGSQEVSVVADRVRQWFYRRFGICSPHHLPA